MNFALKWLMANCAYNGSNQTRQGKHSPAWVVFPPLIAIFKRRNTMDKETIKAFIAWLEEASLGEIQRRVEEIKAVEASRNLSTEGLADLRLARRLIDEELIARLDFSRAQTANDRDA
jgi:hypothetical protein